MKDENSYLFISSILLLLIFTSCEGNIDYQKLDEVTSHVKSYTFNYNEVELRFGEWEAVNTLDGFPSKVVTFDESILKEKVVESAYSVWPSTTIYNSEKGKIVGFNRFDHEGEQIERGMYYNVSTSGWVMKVINVHGDTVRNEAVNIENERYKMIITSDYVSDFFQKYETRYAEGYLVNSKNWISTVENVFNDDPNEFRYEYLEFDQHGNWTRRLVYNVDSEEPNFMAIRTFEYFDE